MRAGLLAFTWSRSAAALLASCQGKSHRDATALTEACGVAPGRMAADSAFD